jgi:hypothetical protein
VNAQHAADVLEIELTEAGVPRAYHCEVITGCLAWFRYLRGRGNIIQRVGFAFAVEALKLVEGKYCKENP